MKNLLVVLLLAICSAGMQSCSNEAGSNSGKKDTSRSTVMGESANAMNESKVRQLDVDMRKLWEDHITWTRNVILCLVDNLPGSDEAIKRLMQNQDDIGNAIKPYYGDDAAKKLTGLLHDHIAISADVVKSAKANNKKGLDDANKKWFDNADQISTFLSGANPDNWKPDDMKMMMHDHLKLTTDEAMARIKKDYTADTKAYDKVHDEILKMADDLSDGIVKQFPDKFK